MIQCEKCGKIYDFDKYNGICPVCCRFNRKTSASLERDLHKKYDHIADAHEKFSCEKYMQGKTAPRTKESGKAAPVKKNPGRQTAGAQKSAAAAKGIIGLVVTLIAIVPAIIEGVRSMDLVEEIPEMGEFFSDDDVWVEYSWSDYLGDDLSQVNWTDYSVSLSEEDQSFLDDYEEDTDQAYLLITLEVYNDSSDTFDLTSVNEEDLVWVTEDDMEISCLKVFHGYYLALDTDDYGYIDCLVAVPMEYAQENMDDYVEAKGTCDLGLGEEPCEFDTDLDFFSMNESSVLQDLEEYLPVEETL